MKIFKLSFVTLFFILLAHVSVTSQLLNQEMDFTGRQHAQLSSDQVIGVESPSSSKKIHLAYTTAYDSNKIIPVDLMTGLKGNPLLSQYHPKTIVISPDGQKAYLFTAGAYQIIPIDLTTELAELPILLPSVPKTMAIDAENQLAYVIYEHTNQITKLDLSNGQASDWVVLNHFPDYLSLDSSGKILYVGYQNLNEITPVDLTSAVFLPSFFLKDALQGMITTQEGRTICINQNDANVLSFLNIKIDTSNQMIAEEGQVVNLDKRIQSVSLSADREVMYVIYENSTEITPINLTHKIVHPSIPLGQTIQSITLYPKHELMASFIAHLAPVGKPSLFDASLSKPFKGAIVDYHWDFGDGHVLLVETPIVTHAYEKSGIFNVNLIVTEMLENFPFQSSENEGLVDPLTPLKTQVTQSVEVLDHLKNKQDSSIKIKKDLAQASEITPSTTTLSSTAPSIPYEQTVTFSAVVSGTEGIPTGQMTFTDTISNNVLGTGNLDNTGTATLPISTLIPGNYSVVASYPGDAMFTSSDSSAAPVSLTVTPAATTTTLTSSVNPSFFGSLTLTATIIYSGTAVPTGTVNFNEGAILLGTGTVSGGVATFNASTLAPGSHLLTATYNGDSNFNGSTSVPLNQTINLATTMTNIISDTLTGTFGLPIIFTASVNLVSGAGSLSGTVTFKDGATTIGSPVNLSSGQASITTSSLSAGTHSMTAVYNGNADVAASTSLPLSQLVNAGTTSVNLTSDMTSSTYGQPVTFKASVSVLTGMGMLTGTVTFKDGATTIGSPVILVSGQASITTNSLSVGMHSITAVYGADPNFSSSTSSAQNQTVERATPLITLSTAPNPSDFGGTVILASTISAPTSVGLPSGTVSFYDVYNGQSSVLLGTESLSGTGPHTSTATLSISNFNAGTHAITAVYNGDGNFVSVTSTPSVNQGVKLALRTDTSLLSTSPNPTVYGQPVHLTALITGVLNGKTSPIGPTGTVTFYDGATAVTDAVTVNSLGNSTFVSVATASLTTLTVADSPHTLTAVYSGDVNYPSSTSSVVLLQKIINTNTSTLLTSSANPSRFQQEIVYTAVVSSVTPGGGNPTGIVNFYNGATLIGAGILSNGPGANSSTATIPTSTLALGSHFVTAVYEGNVDFNSSSSNLVKQAVIQTSTAITLSSSSNPSNFGDPLTITAQIAATSPGKGTSISPTGTVQFYDGTTLLGTENIANGNATFSTFEFYPGEHVLTAIYSGDINFTTSTSTQFTQIVQNTLPTTTTIISSSRNSSPTSQPVTFNAQVTAKAGTPTGGTVTFYVQPIGGTLMEAGTATLSNGLASFQVAGSYFSTDEEYNITASYTGNPLGYYDDSSMSTPFSEYIVPIDTSVILTSNPNHSTQAGATLTAVVTPNPNTFPLTGTVAFYDGNTPINGTVNFDRATGIATLAPDDLHFNARSITAVYTGDDTTYAMAVSNPLIQQVQQTDMLTTTTTLSTPISVTYSCQPIILTAHVMVTSEGFYNPTGSVTFFDGNIEIGTALLDSSGPTYSVAMLSVSDLAVGSHVLSATYNSDSNYAFSQSSPLTQTILSNNTKTTLSIIPAINPTPFGENLILSAMVTATFGTPTGTMIFSSETDVLGEVTLDSTGAAFLDMDTLSVGSHTITADYPATSCFNASIAVVTQGVSLINPMTDLTSQPSTSVYGQAVTFTATVTSPVGTPTGTVSFYNGTTSPSILLGKAPIIEGLATLTTSSLPPGFLTINAIYSGDENFSATGLASLIQTVTLAPTTLCLTSHPTPSVFGQTVTLTATLSSSVPQPTGEVTFNLGTTLLGTVPLNGCETARLETLTLPVGVNTITATYTGDSYFLPSLPATATQIVNEAATMTTVTSTPDPSTFGTSVTFNVTVTAVSPGTGVPTGTVTGYLGSQNLGSGTLSNGATSFKTSALPVGTQTITIQYNPPNPSNFTTSKGTITQVVTPMTSTTVLTAAPATPVFGQSVILTAKVTPTTASGTVTFLYGTTTLGSQVLTASEAGVATLVVSTLPFGANANMLTAIYSGNANIASSTSAAISQAVTKAHTTTTLSSFTTPSYYGESVTFTAAVAAVDPGTGVPTGSVIFSDGATTLGSIALINGQASFTATNLSTGSHPITATYSVTTNYATSTSAALTQIVGKNATTTSAIYSTTNSPQITVTVIPNNPINTGAALPTGFVNVYAGMTKVGSATLTSDGTVIFSPSTIPIGSQTLEVQYTGDGNYLPSTAPLALNIPQVISTTTLVSSGSSSAFGQPVTLTAAVTTAYTPFSGSITFFEGTTNLGTVMNTNPAMLTLNDLAVGSHAIVAVYSGTLNIAGSASAALAQTVTQSTTTTTLSAPSSATYGDVVTFNATVSPNGSGKVKPTGTITFSNGGTVLGIRSVNSTGQAFFSTNLLGAGTYSITATYHGDSDFIASSSIATSPNLMINKATPTLDLLSSWPNPSMSSQNVSFFAAVGSNVGQPTGNITFYSDVTAPANALGTISIFDGLAILTTNVLSIGRHSITATYSGDANFTTANFSSLIQIVTNITTPATTNVTFIATPSTQDFGQPVHLEVQVQQIHDSPVPTGNVTFYYGSTPIITVGLDSLGVASYSTSSLPAGILQLVAIYSGDSVYAFATKIITETINPINTMTTLSSSLNPSPFGDEINFTATVKTASGSIPTNSVTFYEGSTILGTFLLNNEGKATYTTSTLSPGNHMITATYNADSNFVISSGSVPQTVLQAPASTIILHSSINPSQVGETVTFVATVALDNSSSVTPTGSVTFFDGSLAIATVRLDQKGLAIFSTSHLTLGTHALTAVYSGDIHYNPVTSAILFQTINASQIPHAPQNFHGYQVKNKFVNQTQLINILTWDAPLTGNPPLSYKIYRDAQLTHLVAHVSAKHALKYKEFDVKKNRRYTYYIVAITSSGVSIPASVIVYPENETCEVELF